MSDDVLLDVRTMFEQCFGTGEMALADAMFSPDFVDHSTSPAPVPGIEGFKMRIYGLRKTFPDATYQVDDIFASGDRVAFRWTMRGTDTGGMMGRPATGNSVVVTGINIERMENGKIVEHWTAPDNLGLLRQLGIMG